MSQQEAQTGSYQTRPYSTVLSSNNNFVMIFL